MLDPRDTPVSTEDTGVLQAYEDALLSFQSFVGDPVSQLNRVLQDVPDFVLGHLFRAIAFYLSSEQRFLAPAQQSLQAAEGLLAQANHREKLLFAAVHKLVNGQWAAAGRALDEVLLEYPRDALALQAGHLLDFFRGDAANLRNRPSRVLPEWDEDTPGYSYVLGMYAFGLEECNQYAQAEECGRRALQLNRKDAWSVHAVTHVFEMQGRSREGITFLREREADWAVQNNFAYHNWWHLGLLHLEHHEDQQVLDVFDNSIAPGGEITLALLDATAMLWRLHLLGVDYGRRMQPVMELWSEKMAREAGYYAFNDFHAALAFCAAHAVQDLKNLTEHLSHHAGADNLANVAMTRQVGLPLVLGMQAYQQGDFLTAVQHLDEVRGVAQQFGGSHAQRDIVDLTLLSAACKAGLDKRVRSLLNERQMNKPGGVLGQRVLAAA